ncbi:MAG TPA: EamA family transporter [Candidatus Binatia bacterium]|nr:EamA family transporter [Candidatus Binatia bacterium]
MSPTLLVVAFGMLASLGWGLADFGGGLASRRAPVVAVLLASQSASLLLAIPLVLVAGEPNAQPTDLARAALGGITGAAGLGTLYHALSVGRMGVVAPVAAVVTAGMPVAFGFATQGIPSALAIAGIALATVAVVLVSRSTGPDEGRPSGFWQAVFAGATFGLFPIITDGISDDLLVTPVAVVRIASVATIGAFVLARRPTWRVPRRLLPALFAIGVVDMLATAAYLSALAIGPLAIAAILSSLYPVVTVVLAALVLRERIAAIQAVGIAAAGLAVVLIAGA